MKNLNTLRDEYPGNFSWENFVSAFKDDWSLVRDKERYTQAFGDEEIAIVLSIKMGERSLGWFDHPNAALDGHSPRAILKNQPEGEKIVRTLLMRTP